MLTDSFAPALSELLFTKSEDFIGIYDLTTRRFTRVNEAGVHLLGFPSEQALLADDLRGRSLRLQPLPEQQLNELITQLLQRGYHEETTEISRNDGQLFWAHLSLHAFTANQQPYALVRLVDQGRLHKAERELAHSVRRYEAIFSNATIGIIVCDEAGHIVSANQMAGRLLGYESNELTTLTIEQLVPMQVRHYHEKLRQSFNADPQVRAMGHNRDLHAQRKDGSVFPVEISLSYFKLDQKLYTVAFVIDITFKKEAERQLLQNRDRIEQLNADLEQKVADRTHALLNTLEQLELSKDELAKALAAERELGELKSRFVSMASHEFRTPLTTVLTSATLIEKYGSADEQDKRMRHLNRIRSSVNHLNDILEEFLSLGRLEEGKIMARPAEVDMEQLVTETVADMQSLLKAGQTIHTQLACPGLVWIDPSLVRKVLVNLLSNAIKYSGTGSVVSLAGNCVDDQLRIRITDQGIGISKEDQEHLFERFFRAKNANNIAGTGLGLHIVGRYVDLLGGSVLLESELNQGTTITLTLPFEKVASL